MNPTLEQAAAIQDTYWLAVNEGNLRSALFRLWDSPLSSQVSAKKRCTFCGRQQHAEDDLERTLLEGADGRTHRRTRTRDQGRNMKTATLPDFLTEAQIKKAVRLFERHGLDAAPHIKREVILPNMDAIDAKLGQENDPSYLAYCVMHVLSEAGRPRAS